MIQERKLDSIKYLLISRYVSGTVLSFEHTVWNKANMFSSSHRAYILVGKQKINKCMHKIITDICKSAIGGIRRVI